jgi:aldehyde dehydrogenase (NAD+)/betaine-aldehyde dehydrogenase
MTDTSGQTLLIDGARTGAADGATLPSYDPATGERIADLSRAGKSDVDAAVAAAERAFHSPEWSRMLPRDRARLLFRLADALEARSDEFAALESLDQGQPMWAAYGSVQDSVDQFRYFGGWVTKLSSSSTPLSIPDSVHRSARIPLGVCALITPWNFPLLIAVWKIAPALATGNTVVVKPAEQTSLTTVALAELALEVGFPAGVFNVVTGGRETGQALVEHPGIAKISFTGSVATGRQIAAAAAARLIPVSLELGGKSPSIVGRHADLDEAIAGNLGGGLFNAGQTCAAYSRLYVHSSRADEFTERLAAGAATRILGSGTDAGAQMGPLVSEEHRQRVHGYVQEGIAAGAELRTGGAFAAVPGRERGYFYQPTVFSGATDEMSIVREEIFGPVFSVLTYDDEDEVVARANASEFGLAAVVWSREIGEANRIAEGVQAGTVWINSIPMLDVGSAWGGFKSSGSAREMGWEAILAFTGVKSTITNIAPREPS